MPTQTCVWVLLSRTRTDKSQQNCSGRIWFCSFQYLMSVRVTKFVTLLVERYYAVCHSVSYQSRVLARGHHFLLASYILPSILLAVLFNGPKLIQLMKIIKYANISTQARFVYVQFGIIYQVSSMEPQGFYNPSLKVFHPLITCCIMPILITTYLNYKICQTTKQMNFASLHQNLDQSMSRVMMTIVALFLIINIPR